MGYSAGIPKFDEKLIYSLGLKFWFLKKAPHIY